MGGSHVGQSQRKRGLIGVMFASAVSAVEHSLGGRKLPSQLGVEEGQN